MFRLNSPHKAGDKKMTCAIAMQTFACLAKKSTKKQKSEFHNFFQISLFLLIIQKKIIHFYITGHNYIYI